MGMTQEERGERADAEEHNERASLRCQESSRKTAEGEKAR